MAFFKQGTTFITLLKLFWKLWRWQADLLELLFFQAENWTKHDNLIKFSSGTIIYWFCWILVLTNNHFSFKQEQ